MSCRARGALDFSILPAEWLPLPPPPEVCLTHHGTDRPDAGPTVRAGDAVLLGQLLAPGAGPYAPVFSSVSGRVRAVSEQTILLENDRMNTRSPRLKAHATADELAPDELRALLGSFGLLPPGAADRPLVLNALVPEPGLDDGFLLREPERVFGGLRLYLRACRPAEALVAVGRRQQEVRRLAVRCGFSPRVLSGRYPQAREPVLLQALFGRRLPPGGCAVLSPEALGAVWDAVYDGLPPVFCEVTLHIQDRPSNLHFRVPAGTPAEHILRAAREAWPVTLAGGLLTGRPLAARGEPVAGLSLCLSCLELPEPRRPARCLSCGRCAAVCPAGLWPALLRSLSRRRQQSFGAPRCLRCNLCAAVCPAGLPVWYQTAKKEALHGVGAVSPSE